MVDPGLGIVAEPAPELDGVVTEVGQGQGCEPVVVLHRGGHGLERLGLERGVAKGPRQVCGAGIRVQLIIIHFRSLAIRLTMT